MKHVNNFFNFKKSKINEGIFQNIKILSSWKNNKELIHIWIKCYKNKENIEQCFIQNNNIDISEVNIKLMNILNDKFHLNLIKRNGIFLGSLNEFDYTKINDISNFLIKLGIEKINFKQNNMILFNGKLSLLDLNNRKNPK